VGTEDSSDRLLRFLIVGSAVGICVFLFTNYSAIPVNRDAGYYLPIAREVLAGKTPTVEVDTAYTPFVYYLYAAWMGWFGTTFSVQVLLVYLVNLLNVLLLLRILRRERLPAILGILLCASYFCTLMVCQGYAITLEPFQVFFLLAAFSAWSGHGDSLGREAMIGLLLGVAIMIKQYSALICLGFVLIICMDSAGKGRRARGAIRILVLGTAAAVPLLVFILLTPASLPEALHAFGFIGGKAVSYATAEKTTLYERLGHVFLKVAHLHWLFLPVLFFAIPCIRRDADRKRGAVLLVLLVVSALPIWVRQFGHYFLLVAPWSYLLWGWCLGTCRDFWRGEGSRHLLVRGLVLVGGVLPAFLALTPESSRLTKLHQITVLAFFLLLSALVLLPGFFRHGAGKRACAVLVFSAILCGLETAFLSLKLPYGEMSEQKSRQEQEARAIGEVLPKGTRVLVVDYPELYVTCDFRNESNYYGFIYPSDFERKFRRIQWNKRKGS